MTPDLDRLEAANRWLAWLEEREKGQTRYEGQPWRSDEAAAAELRELRTRLAALEQPVEAEPDAYLLVGENFRNTAVSQGQALRWSKIYDAKITPLYASVPLSVPCESALQVHASSAKTADDSASGGQRVEAPAWTGGCSLCPARFSTAWELEQHEKEHLQTDASAYTKYVADQALENAAQRVFNNGVRVGAEEMKRRCGEAILSCPDGEHVVNIYRTIRALPLDPQS